MLEAIDPTPSLAFISGVLSAAEEGWAARIQSWADAEGAAGLALLSFGFIAQALFFTRWIVQWAASERRKQSHIPPHFWWLSLLGASMLFIYFTLRAEPVGMLGQSVGWIVYMRNLILLRRNGNAPLVE